MFVKRIALAAGVLAIPASTTTLDGVRTVEQGIIGGETAANVRNADGVSWPPGAPASLPARVTPR